MRLTALLTALLTAAALSVSLAACQPPVEVVEDVVEDGATPAASSVSPAADMAGAEAFVRELYSRYEGDPMEAGEASDDFWSARTEALLDENAAAADGGVGYLGADPICSCQDWGDFSLNTVVVSATGDATANAAVTFSNFGGAHSQVLMLVFEDGAWKVDDIRYTSGEMANEPPLVEGVQQSTEELRAQG